MISVKHILTTFSDTVAFYGMPTIELVLGDMPSGTASIHDIVAAIEGNMQRLVGQLPLITIETEAADQTGLNMLCALLLRKNWKVVVKLHDGDLPIFGVDGLHTVVTIDNLKWAGYRIDELKYRPRPTDRLVVPERAAYAAERVLYLQDGWNKALGAAERLQQLSEFFSNTNQAWRVMTPPKFEYTIVG